MSGFDFALEHERRLRGHNLVLLRDMWGDAYLIEWDHGHYVAKRRDGKGELTDVDSSRLWTMLRDDLSTNPVELPIRLQADQSGL
jgi:hypothetical protein